MAIVSSGLVSVYVIVRLTSIIVPVYQIVNDNCSDLYRVEEGEYYLFFFERLPMDWSCLGRTNDVK
jgi:hypothetical protein